MDELVHWIQLIGALVFLVAVVWLAVWFDTRHKPKVHLPKPVLGVVNLGGNEFEALITEDLKILSPGFEEVIVQSEGIPKCDVLFLYATLASDGSLGGGHPPLRQLAAEAGAQIAVLATDQAPALIDAALKAPGPKTATLLLTVDRRGTAFASFVGQLFKLMRAGQTFGWAVRSIVRKVHQIKDRPLPVMVFRREGSPVTFSQPFP